MRGSMQVENPREVLVTLSATATMEQWLALREALKDGPYYGVIGDLRNLIDETARDLSRRSLHLPDPDKED